MDTDFENLPPLNLQSPAFGASDWSYTETPHSTESSHVPTGGGSFNHAFKIETRINEALVKQYRVLDFLSTITDGTNGDSLGITDLADSSDADSGWQSASSLEVLVEGDVDSSLEVTNLSVTLGSYDGEVVFDAATPPAQTHVRLLIGKVIVDGDTVSASQATITAQRLTHGILNGAAVRVFEAAPTHPDSL